MMRYAMYRSKIQASTPNRKTVRSKSTSLAKRATKGTRLRSKRRLLEHLAGERRNRNMKIIVIPFMLIVAVFLVYVIVV
jgi:hypothetical protein